MCHAQSTSGVRGTQAYVPKQLKGEANYKTRYLAICVILDPCDYKKIPSVYSSIQICCRVVPFRGPLFPFVLFSLLFISSVWGQKLPIIIMIVSV